MFRIVASGPSWCDTPPGYEPSGRFVENKLDVYPTAAAAKAEVLANWPEGFRSGKWMWAVVDDDKMVFYHPEEIE